jgi:hypothetical protein
MRFSRHLPLSAYDAVATETRDFGLVRDFDILDLTQPCGYGTIPSRIARKTATLRELSRHFGWRLPYNLAPLTANYWESFPMRRIMALVVALGCLNSLGCQVVRDIILGEMVERYDSSGPASERRAAYDDYIREYVDR